MLHKMITKIAKVILPATAIIFVLAIMPGSAKAEATQKSPAGENHSRKDSFAANRPAEDRAPLEQTEKYTARVHDPSTIVKCKDEYWLFSTGRGIASHHSKDLVHWQPGPHVFDTSPAWTTSAVPENRGFFWAPDVIHLHNRFLLYYSVSKFGLNTSAIGLVANPTLDPADCHYAWTDQGIVIQSAKDDNFNTIDPSVIQDEKGNLWLAFGSFWSGIKLIQLDPSTGKCLAPDSPVYSLAYNESIEAACLHRHGDYYYLFVNWDICCRGTESTYNIRVGRSANITGPYLDKEGRDLLQNGGTLFLETSGSFIGPGHAGILSADKTDWLSYHYYDGDRHGAPTLAIRRLLWDADGWPMIDKSPDSNPKIKVPPCKTLASSRPQSSSACHFCRRVSRPTTPRRLSPR